MKSHQKHITYFILNKIGKKPEQELGKFMGLSEFLKRKTSIQGHRLSMEKPVRDKRWKKSKFSGTGQGKVDITKI